MGRKRTTLCAEPGCDQPRLEYSGGGRAPYCQKHRNEHSNAQYHARREKQFQRILEIDYVQDVIRIYQGRAIDAVTLPETRREMLAYLKHEQQRGALIAERYPEKYE